jgi:uncharacterized protein YggE
MKLHWFIFALAMPVAVVFADEQPAADQNPRTIEVEGHGEARTNPDQASMSFAIEAEGSTAQEAGEQIAQTADKVVAALNSKIGASGKIVTGGYSMAPIYATAAGRRDKVSSWFARYEIAVDCDPSEAGGVLDAAQSVGIGGSIDIRTQSPKALVNLYVNASALTADDTIKRVSERVNEVVDKIKPKLGANSTIKVWTGSVHAQSNFNGQSQEIIGYKASNSISVETGNIDQIGSLIDTATAAGASRVTTVNFKLRDDSQARSEAVASACKDAQLKANAAAKALGLKIKRIMKITNVGDAVPPPSDSEDGAEPVVSPVERGTTPVKPDKLTVPASVTVTYELE